MERPGGEDGAGRHGMVEPPDVHAGGVSPGDQHIKFKDVPFFFFSLLLSSLFVWVSTIRSMYSEYCIMGITSNW